MKKEKITEFSCKGCKSNNTYTTETHKVCRKCGYRELLKEVKEK